MTQKILLSDKKKKNLPYICKYIHLGDPRQNKRRFYHHICHLSVYLLKSLITFYLFLMYQHILITSPN